MKSKTFIVLICLEIICIMFLFIYIQRQITNFNVLTNSIDSRYIQKFPSIDLKHFYEPKANTTEVSKANWSPFDKAKYTINSDSLNERFDYDVRKKPGVFRIVTIGDSFTFGQHVSTENNWTELLEDYLNLNNKCKNIDKYEVINLGVPGYDWAYEAERYGKRGIKYNPDLLITLIVDFGRVTEYRLENQNKITLSDQQKEEFKKQGIFYPEINILDEQLSNSFKINYQKQYINKIISLYNGPFLWVDFEKNPIYKSLIASIMRNDPKIIYERTSLSWKDKQYLLPDLHPNIEGHKKLMEEIAGFLIKDKLIPCKQ